MKKRTAVLLAVLSAIVLLVLWVEGTLLLFKSTNPFLFGIGFWGGYWTVTGWAFYLVVVGLVIWMLFRRGR